MKDPFSVCTVVETKLYEFDKKLRFRIEVVRAEAHPSGGSYHCYAEVYMLRVGSPVGKVGQISGDWSFKPGWLLIEDFPRVQAIRPEDVLSQIQKPLSEYAQEYRRQFPLDQA